MIGRAYNINEATASGGSRLDIFGRMTMIAEIQNFENAARLSMANYGDFDTPAPAVSGFGVASIIAIALVTAASLAVLLFFI